VISHGDNSYTQIRDETYSISHSSTVRVLFLFIYLDASCIPSRSRH